MIQRDGRWGGFGQILYILVWGGVERGGGAGVLGWESVFLDGALYIILIIYLYIYIYISNNSLIN